MATHTTGSERLDPHATPAGRRKFVLNAAQWDAFIAALDAPPRPLPRLERLLNEPGFFDGVRATD